MHDLITFSYSVIFYASLYSSYVSCSSSYSGVLDFLIDLGRYVLAIGARVCAQMALVPDTFAFGEWLEVAT